MALSEWERKFQPICWLVLHCMSSLMQWAGSPSARLIFFAIRVRERTYLHLAAPHPQLIFQSMAATPNLLILVSRRTRAIFLIAACRVLTTHSMNFIAAAQFKT